MADQSMLTLMNDLNTFNLKYAKYVKCNGATTLLHSCAPDDFTCCSYKDQDMKSLSNLQTKIERDITSFNTSVGKYDKLSLQQSDFDGNHEKIIQTGADVQKLRQDLDIKMKEIYNLDGTVVNDSFIQYESSMYTGLLFTILTTTILYYTFTKL
jgi:peptidoglycan hydrolase CwlO-like protein